MGKNCNLTLGQGAMAILVQESTFHVIWNGEFRMGISNISGEI
jgi:hypothetical protein